MKKVVLNLAVSLDGFIEGPNKETDWCIMDAEMDFGAFLDSVDTIFYGRVSYEAWGKYQPESTASTEHFGERFTPKTNMYFPKRTNLAKKIFSSHQTSPIE